MRFDWRKDTNKKAKILRKVTFPQELDTVEFCADDLKKMLVPICDKIRDIRKEEDDNERARKRQKRMKDGEENTPDKERVLKGKEAATEKSLSSKNQKSSDVAASSSGADTDMPDIEYKTDAQIEAERAASILAAKKELLGLVNEKLSEDSGANQTGLYELRGVITHQGISADSGHYTANGGGSMTTRCPKSTPTESRHCPVVVSPHHVSSSLLLVLTNSPGQSHSALILLYRAVPLPSIEDDEKMQV